jgi:error-prone DNA polymerase
MGLRYVKGFGERQRERIERTLGQGAFDGPEDFVRRTRLSRKLLQALAEAGGFASMGIARRDAVWAIRGLCTKLDDALVLPGDVAPASEQPVFSRLDTGEAILWDYRTSMHSTRGHPLESIRAALNRRGLPVADQLEQMPSGRRLDYVGLVICRQRPGTASGVTFYTLEDETGFVNLVVWRQVFEQDAVLAKTALLLGVTGKLQAQHGVVHLIAERLWTPDVTLQAEGAKSRDFH